MSVPEIGILNDSDQPRADMLAIKWKGKTGWRWAYIDHRKGSGARSNKWIGFGRFTPLSEFGQRADLSDVTTLTVSTVGPSLATYRDGRPRRWQGDHHPKSVEVHVELLPKIELALAAKPPQAGGAA